MKQIAAAFSITQSCGHGDHRSHHSLLRKVPVTLFAVSLPMSLLIIKNMFIALPLLSDLSVLIPSIKKAGVTNAAYSSLMQMEVMATLFYYL